MLFQSCGGAFVKFGQMLALRSDIISEQLASELLSLLEKLPPVSFTHIQRVIAEELGGVLSDHFKGIDVNPLAVASFAQVHRAQLHTGEIVAVKVQKPGIEKSVLVDIQILRFVAYMLDTVLPLYSFSARSFVNEFAIWTQLELDYELEAKNLELIRSQNRLHSVKIPQVFWSFTTRRVLTEEYIEGISVARLVEQPFHPEYAKIARTLLEASIFQYFLTGVFHADPHPGNILVDADISLCYVDFGMIGKTREHYRMAMGQFISHAINKRYQEAIEAFLMLGFSQRITKDMRHFMDDPVFLKLFFHGIGIMKSIMVRKFSIIMDTWFSAVHTKDATFAEKSAAKAFLALLNIARRYHIKLDQEIILFVKALIAVDAISLRMDPQFNLIKVLNSIFSQEAYSWLFTDIAQDYTEVESKPFLTKTPDKERARLLKDYYTQWFGELVEQHPKDFKSLTHKMV